MNEFSTSIKNHIIKIFISFIHGVRSLIYSHTQIKNKRAMVLLKTSFILNSIVVLSFVIFDIHNKIPVGNFWKKHVLRHISGFISANPTFIINNLFEPSGKSLQLQCIYLNYEWHIPNSSSLAMQYLLQHWFSSTFKKPSTMEVNLPPCIYIVK